MNKCASCKSFYEPIQKPNGKYYKSCNRCLLKSNASRCQRKKMIDNTHNTIDEYLNIIRLKDSIIEKLTTDNKNLNNIVNDYKMTLYKTQQQTPNIKNDERLDEMIKQLMKK